MRQLLSGANTVRATLKRRPSALTSLRLLGPRLNAAQHLHRELLLRTSPSRSRPIAGAVLLLQWILWITFRAWKQTWQVVDRRGPAIVDAYAVPLRRQRAQVLRLALVHGVSPRDYYDLGLHEDLGRMWEFVFEYEAAAFHRLRDGHTRDTHNLADKHRLADKHSAALAFGAAGIRVVETKVLLPAGQTWRDLPDTGTDQMFAKPRIGSRARSVFRYRRSGGDLQAWDVDGQHIAPENVECFVDDCLRNDEFILQRYYPTHPALLALGDADRAAITLRVVTERASSGEIDIYCAYLEVPIAAGGSSFWPAFAVDVERGTIAGLAQRSLVVHPKVAGLQASAVGLTVPAWPEAVRAAQKAHELEPDRFALAWDFVVAPEGPVLLEGNTTWSLQVPQLIRGPLARDWGTNTP